jgi:amino acid transporter
VVVLIFLAAAAVYVAHHPHDAPGFFTQPFYDPQTWPWQSILSATSLAMLTYIGFDGISTLSEEAENPRRNILIATVLTCVLRRAAGLGTLIRRGGCRHRRRSVGGRNCRPVGSGPSVVRDGTHGALPKRFFGAIHARTYIPLNNVLFVGFFCAHWSPGLACNRGGREWL